MACPRCASPLGLETDRCPECGEDVQLTATAPGAGFDSGPGSDDPKFLPGEIFARRYTIVERAGGGGMGIVYKAIDTSLGLTVALKLIQPRLARLPAFVERFKSEVRLTRQVTHPNVCRVHDLGELDGVMYLSMEWIQGATLRQLLKRAGVLKAVRAIEIAEKIAFALEAAHGRSVVHRDLKPENVMIDDRGEVYVLDFGLAATRGSFGADGGVPRGTPPYMAPEQRAEGLVDARTDLYSLGLILREMLTGRLPDPEHPARVRGDRGVPRPIRPILDSLLAEDRARRPASAMAVTGILRDLRTTSAEAIAAASTDRFGHRRAPLLAAAAILALAAAAGYHWFETRPERTSVRGPIDTEKARDYHQRALHYLREKSEGVRGLDDAIHMFQRAVASDPGFALAWAGLGEAYWTRYERRQDSVAREEAEQAVQEAFRLSPDLPEARVARARGLIVEGKYKEAVAELQAAVARNPRLAEAWMNLAFAHEELDEYAAAFDAVRKAIALEPTNFRYRIVLGLLHEHFEEQRAAEEAYRQAVDLKPDSTSAWNNLGAALLRQERWDQAEAAFLRSIEIDDRDKPRSNLGTIYYSRGQYERAAESYRRAADLEPEQPIHWGNLGDALLAMGRGAEAREAYGQAAKVVRGQVAANPRNPRLRERLALYCGKAGDLECALAEIGRAVETQPGNAGFAFSYTTILCLAGRPGEALQWLEKAVKLGYPKPSIEMAPELKTLRSDPAYRRILQLAR